MKRMRLSDLTKRSNKYFRKFGKVKYGTSERTSRYIARRTFESLPKRYRQFIEEDKDKYINLLVHNLKYSQAEGGMDFYKAIEEAGRDKYKKIYSTQKRELWNEFRTMESAVYNHFNTYMYRLGYSASKYWFENVKFESIDGTSVHTELELPPKAFGVKYTKLIIDYRYSGGYFIQAYMY